ncbi:DUF4358 domain-containing protein [Paenibacillus sp. N4]|uniref:DUF4358 domain-containing protein n=1 Tax=Paenibacillus vietnamensis TaxID=2590547 RepID=UPI001CD16A21|nr:DUF4358 domain-containing protein [Paenibacillus vietnamensis]MCA0754750.1 DUF4358 domain-containing protein [Paenibacillus vietnamensis]
MAGMRSKLVNLAIICISITVIGSGCSTGANVRIAGSPAGAAETPAIRTEEPGAAPSASTKATGHEPAASPDTGLSSDEPNDGQTTGPDPLPGEKPAAGTDRVPAVKPSAIAKPAVKSKATDKPAASTDAKPTRQPAAKPTAASKPSAMPSITPAAAPEPSSISSAVPSPTEKPTGEPTLQPTEKPEPTSNVTVAEIAAKLTEELKLGSLEPVEGEKIKKLYGIDAESLLSEYSFNQAMIMIQAGEFSVVKLKSDDAYEAVKAGFEKRAETVRKNFENYLQDQYEQAKNYQIVRSGRYVLFSISPDQQKAAELFNAFFD